MKATGIFWNGGPNEITGKVVKEYPTGITIDDGFCTFFIPWRHVIDDLFIPHTWAENIKADRAKWK